MKKTALIALVGALFAATASAQPADRGEDRWDRREDRRDVREDVRDRHRQGGPADRVEDRVDRREDRRDAREDVRDHANTEWWRGRPEFRSYAGVRPGYYFAPGYGYYPIPAAYYGRRWVRGVVLPVALRRYPVADIAIYRLRPAPRGYLWVHLDHDIVLISSTSGMIMEVVVGVW